MNFYKLIKEKNNYTPEQEKCIDTTVEQISKTNADDKNPAMLFGEIQSGKTRTFIGIIASCFDNGYDVCIVLTKNSIALAEQTFKRFDNNFQEAIDDGLLNVFNIMQMPNKIAGATLNEKIIIVAKKQTHNLNMLVRFLDKYEILDKKKVLIVDDEADNSSVGFKKDKSQEDGISANVIMNKINLLRRNLTNRYTFLQVTATPYSLYLQPGGATTLNKNLYHPNRPTITTLVPNHEKYIGGKYYFEESENVKSPASLMFNEISVKELKSLSGKKISQLVINKGEIKMFKKAILNYVVGSCIRIIQERKQSRRYKTSFLIHIDKAIDNMKSLLHLSSQYLEVLKKGLEENDKNINADFEDSYQDLNASIDLAEFESPNFDAVLAECKKILIGENINVITVNSEEEAKNLLDRNGQLKLTTQLNIFIGGNALDRGITIENMIGFFYGRNPQTFQQDTVLQHSRMYGARSKEDLAVTRFYTTTRIYLAMKQMYEFDTELREAFAKGKNKDGVVFVNIDPSQKIRPCSPSKILISTTTSVKAGKRYLPIGFNSKAKTFVENSFNEILEILKGYKVKLGVNKYIELSYSDFYQISVLISRTLDYSKNPEYKWDFNSFVAIAKQTCENEKLHCFIKWNRNVSRLKNDGTRFQDSPDDGNIDLPKAREIAISTPSLILTHQEGKKKNGWEGDYNFFWPVLVTPQNTQAAIFASEYD